MPRPKRTMPGLAETYKRIRKPVPPPSKVEKDRRRQLKDRLSRREAEDDLGREQE